jgi:hypothetical protein
MLIASRVHKSRTSWRVPKLVKDSLPQPRGRVHQTCDNPSHGKLQAALYRIDSGFFVDGALCGRSIRLQPTKETDS